MATGDSQALDMEATGWSFAAVSIVLVAARLYTRFKLIHQPGWDDFWIVFALVSTDYPVPSTKLLSSPTDFVRANLCI